MSIQIIRQSGSLKLDLAVKGFVESIKDVKFLQPDGDPKPEWKVFHGATWSAARQSATEALENPKNPNTHFRDMVYSKLIVVQLSFYDLSGVGLSAAVAKYETGRAVLKAVTEGSVFKNKGDSEHTAITIAEDAAREAELMAHIILHRDANVSETGSVIKEAERRWEVWQKGYALLAEAGGELYVYAPSDKESSLSKAKR